MDLLSIFVKKPVKLDSTPSGQEEYADWNDLPRASGWNIDDAKMRVDKIAHSLVRLWSLFLMWIIVAQGNADGTTLQLFGWDIQILPKFSMRGPEFIAVVTTTTASVFGFLLIVANHLFRSEKAISDQPFGVSKPPPPSTANEPSATSGAPAPTANA